MWSVFIKKDDDWCLCHPRGWKYKHLLFTICTKFVCMFELGCIICLTLNQKNTDLPDNSIHWPLEMKGHNYWQAWHHFLFPVDVFTEPEYTLSHSHSSVCLFRVIVCWHVCREPARLMFLHAFLRNANIFILFFGMNLYIILSASPCSTFVLCCTEIKTCQACLALRCETHKCRRCTLTF